MFLCALGFFLSVCQTANAQKKLNDNTFKISNKETAVIAFFRLAGVAPDYEAWITEGSAYQAFETTKEQEKFLVSEALRLGQGYSQYNPSKSVLEFKTSVIARYTPPEGGKPAKFHFKFPEQSDDYIPVFEYPYGKNSIALVVNRFADFSTLPLTKEQYTKVKTFMPFQDEEYTAKLSMSIRPTRADIDRPLVNKNINQWMMLGEVAYMRCQIVDPTNLQQTQVWEFVAPWYEKEFKEKETPEETKYPSPFDLFKDKK